MDLRDTLQVGDRVRLRIQGIGPACTVHAVYVVTPARCPPLFWIFDPPEGLPTWGDLIYSKHLEPLGVNPNDPLYAGHAGKHFWWGDSSTTVLAVTPRPKMAKYLLQCPCGIVPAMCDYHKDS